VGQFFICKDVHSGISVFNFVVEADQGRASARPACGQQKAAHRARQGAQFNIPDRTHKLGEDDLMRRQQTQPSELGAILPIVWMVFK